MKRRHVPLEKRSKRERKAHFAALRGGWGAIDPLTKKLPNAKAYNRKKSGRRYDMEPPPGLFLL